MLPYDTGMGELFPDGDFAEDLGFRGLVLHDLLLDGLYGHKFPCQFVNPQVHLSERALPKHLADFVEVDCGDRCLLVVLPVYILL